MSSWKVIGFLCSFISFIFIYLFYLFIYYLFTYFYSFIFINIYLLCIYYLFIYTRFVGTVAQSLKRLSYGLDCPVSNPGGDEVLSPSRPALGPTQPPVNWVPVVCQRGNVRKGRASDHSPPSSAAVMEV